jgi:hypothetical protein
MQAIPSAARRTRGHVGTGEALSAAPVFRYGPGATDGSLASWAMNRHEASAIREGVRVELAKRDHFSNFHGITPDNLDSFLVEPFEAIVDPDDLETEAHPMWVVLQLSANPTDGYVVVYDPTALQQWGVAEHMQGDEYVLVIAAASLADALNGL